MVGAFHLMASHVTKANDCENLLTFDMSDQVSH